MKCLRYLLFFVLGFLLINKATSVVYVDYHINSNQISNLVTRPFFGDKEDQLPIINENGIYRNIRNSFHAAAISPKNLITVAHVGPQVGDKYTNYNGHIVTVTKRRTLQYTNLYGIQNADLVLLTINETTKYWYQLSMIRPTNGAPLLAYGRSIANRSPSIVYSGVWYDFETSQWYSVTNETQVFSHGWGSGPLQKVWFRGKYLQYKDFYFASPFTDIYPAYYNDFMAGVVPIGDKNKGYGAASTGDSGSPVFVYQNQAWRYVMSLQSATSYPKTNVNCSMGMPIHIFIPKLQSYIIEDRIILPKPPIIKKVPVNKTMLTNSIKNSILLEE